MPLLFPEIPVCVYCGKELPQGEVCPTCAKFLKRYEVFGRVKYSFACCGAYHYNQLASWIVQAFKFEGARWLSGYLSRMIWRAVQKERFEAVSFVPLHPKRLKQRGFNQAELLAEQIGQLSKRPCFDLLERNRNTRTQSHLPHEVREENVRDAFDLKMESVSWIKGRHILLIDDVVTTGATIQQCAALIKKAGAQVVCAAFAVAAPEFPEGSQ